MNFSNLLLHLHLTMLAIFVTICSLTTLILLPLLKRFCLFTPYTAPPSVSQVQKVQTGIHLLHNWFSYLYPSSWTILVTALLWQTLHCSRKNARLTLISLKLSVLKISLLCYFYLNLQHKEALTVCSSGRPIVGRLWLRREWRNRFTAWIKRNYLCGKVG